MSAKELTEFDQEYQAFKIPTANNLGEKTFQQLVAQAVKKELGK